MRITKTALETILGASRNTYPNEFLAMLRGENDTITELLLIPGTEFQPFSSHITSHMVPLDETIIGSVHSHPGPARPSKADLNFFARHGKIHLIVAYPYSSLRNVRAYTNDGTPTQVGLVP